MEHSDLWHSIRHEIEGQLVFRTDDELGELFVVDHGERRLLYFGAPYEQSCICREAPFRPVHEYARAMLLVLAWAQPEDVLILGLGGGTLIHAIRHSVPDAEVRVVELRESVIRIAREFFQLENDTRLDVVHGDAKVYCRSATPESCDILFADLFTDNRMHPWQQQHKFLVQAHKMLRKHGWLVINFDRYQEPGSPCMNSLLSLFPTLLSVITRDGNHVILASPAGGFDLAEHVGAVEPLAARLEVPLAALLTDVMDLSA